MPRYDKPGSYIEEIGAPPPPIDAVATGVAGFAGRTERGPAGRAVAVSSLADFERSFGSAAWTGSHLPAAVALFFANGGRRALIVRHGAEQPLTAADYLPAEGGAPPLLRPLHDARPPDLLCLPPCRPADELPQGAVAAAQDWCRAHGALLLADPPLSWGGVAAAVAGQEALAPRGPDSAIYLPRLLVAGQPTALVPCGAVAGVIARTDSQRGVWVSPSGREAGLRGITGLAQHFDSGQQALLTPAGINLLRDFGDGCLVWGGRTRSAQPEERYLNHRRALLMIEWSLRRGLAWVAFERNGEPLWQLVRERVTDFLQRLWRAGAFQGASPREAYFVRCDGTTMTQVDLAAGHLICEVGVALLQPAEFATVRVRLASGAANPPAA